MALILQPKKNHELCPCVLLIPARRKVRTLHPSPHRRALGEPEASAPRGIINTSHHHTNRSVAKSLLSKQHAKRRLPAWRRVQIILFTRNPRPVKASLTNMDHIPHKSMLQFSLRGILSWLTALAILLAIAVPVVRWNSFTWYTSKSVIDRAGDSPLRANGIDADLPANRTRNTDETLPLRQRHR
jgi:hypothetical protein